LEQVIEDRPASGASVKGKIGWLCTYTPEEIIIATGFQPSRITGNLKAFKSEGYFPINFCPFIKSSMEDLLASYSDFKGVIFTNSCDGMRRFYDNCRAYIPDLPAFMLDVPRNKNSIAIDHFISSIKEMIVFLQEAGGKKIGCKELEDAINICSKKRMLLKKLSNIFMDNHGLIKVRDYYDILEKSMTEDPHSFICYLKEYLDGIARDLKSPGTSSIPGIMVIGNFINEDRLWGIFDELECNIAAEDMCNSSRYFENITHSPESAAIIESSGAGDPFSVLIKDIAIRQLYKPQCMRMADLGEKISEIIKNIDKFNIKGLVFFSQKFCDNTLLFYPLLREKLAEMNVPSLFIEIEHNNISAGQIKTRLQAFLEII
jgi:benzoyl-CoA reductase/2-hydroxyglutaryl-CoA dehydratase subunit BcrC/BadD/HgdB